MAASTPSVAVSQDEAMLPSRHTGWLMVAVMGVSICQFLDLTIANVALPHMRTSLGAGMDSISWVLTSFIITGVMVLPMTGWLSDTFGSRNIFVWATGAFLLSSALCGAATSLEQMVIFRGIQGIASAFIGPMSQTIMFDINPPNKQARAMSIWGMVVMVAPISGPFIGGFLTDTLNWRWVFYVNLPIGIPALALLWWLLPSRPLVKRPLDIFGAVSLAIAMAALQLVLDRGQNQDWFESTEIIAELMVCVATFWMFCVHSSSTPHPLFGRTLLGNGNFVLALAFMVALGIVNVALSSVLPTMFQSIYGYSVVQTGMLMAPRGMGVAVTMLVASRLAGRADSRVIISVGYLIAALSMWTMTRWSIEMDKTPIIISGFIQGLGLGLVFVPMNLAAFSTMSPEHRPDGMTLMTLFRNLGSSFGISATVTMLARNIQISHSDLAGTVTSADLPALEPGAASAIAGVGPMLARMMDGEINRQAAMIAYLDNFYMMFWVVLCVVPLAWLLRKPDAEAAGAKLEAVHMD